MRACRNLLAGTAVAAIAVGGAVDAGAAKRKRACPHAHTKTVRQNSSVRLFERPSDANRRLYACLRKSRRVVRVVAETDDGYTQSSSYSTVRLAGRFVAWSLATTDISCKADCPPGYSGTTYTIERLDLRSGKSKTIAGDVHGRGLVLTRRGALAWTEEASDGLIDVLAYDRAGSRALDHGVIPARSLKVRGATVKWTNGGAERSAVLD